MRETVVLAIGAAVAFVLQIVLASNIAVLGVMPNFAVAYVASAAMVRQTDSVVVIAFLLGLATDLTNGGTVGLMAALLVLSAFIASRAAAQMGSDTVVASVLISMAGALLAEVCYALFYAIIAEVSVADVLLLRAIPCALYDCAVVLIVMPLLSFLVERAAPPHTAPQSSTVRLR